MRKDAVAHHLPLAGATHRTTDAVAVIAFERAFGRGLVQPLRFEDETQLLHGRLRRELPHAAQRERHRPLLVRSVRRGASLVEFDRAVALQIDETGVTARKDRHGAVRRRRNDHLGIQFFVDPLFEGDRDAFFVDETPPFGHRLGGHVAQHLQLIGRTPHQRTQGHGNRKPDHPRARDADPHRILEDVGAQQHFDPFGAGTQQFGRPRRAQRHCDRLRTTDGGNHFTTDQLDDLRSFDSRNHR